MRLFHPGGSCAALIVHFPNCTCGFLGALSFLRESGTEGFLSEGFLAEGLLLEGFLPEGFLAEGFLPDGYTTEGLLSEGFLPEGYLLEGFAHKLGSGGFGTVVSIFI